MSVQPWLNTDIVDDFCYEKTEQETVVLELYNLKTAL